MNFLMKKLETVKNRKEDSGFSLIELIVVVILLGILAAIAIPAYNGIEDRARASVVEAAASNALKEAIVADSMGSDSSKFEEILDNNSNDDVTVTYHDSSGERSNVPGNPIVVESWWNDGSNEKFNVVVPAPTTPGGSGGVTPPENVDNSLFTMTLLCDSDGTFATRLSPLDEVIITDNSDNSQSVYNDFSVFGDQEFDLLGGIEYTFTASAVGDNFDWMYVARWPGAGCIRSIDSWGSQASDSLGTALEYAPNLEYVAPIPSNVTNISAMFQNSPFNGDLSEWDTSNVENMSQLFAWSGFNNSSISNWDTSSVTDMSSMFSGYDSRFNQDISEWDTSNVTNMNYMFGSNEYFNSPIGEWDTSNVTDMRRMFYGASAFNQDISNWDTSNVTDMSGMFNSTTFSGPLNKWDVSNVENMYQMFYNSSYNQPLNNWNTGNVTDMRDMFSRSDFNQNISNWDVSNEENVMYYSMFASSAPIQHNDDYFPNFPNLIVIDWGE